MTNNGVGISVLDSCDRPREKLQKKGVITLKNEELWAIVLGSGTPNHDVLSLAKTVASTLSPHTGIPQHQDLCAIPGIGPAKACTIQAALELGRRHVQQSGIRLTTPKAVYQALISYATKKQEHLIVLSLNGAQEMIALRVISVGLINQTHIHPREVFADPLTDRAASIIIAHNHPTGELRPSTEDEQMTTQLAHAGKILGIPLQDHIIFNQFGYFSFAADTSSCINKYHSVSSHT
jgi:DNA repair protein RadC